MGDKPVAKVRHTSLVFSKGLALGKEAEVIGPAASALVRRGDALRKSGRHGEALVVSDEVLRRFRESGNPRLQVMATNALANKAKVSAPWAARESSWRPRKTRWIV
jgi:hypothetical protein